MTTASNIPVTTSLDFRSRPYRYVGLPATVAVGHGTVVIYAVSRCMPDSFKLMYPADLMHTALGVYRAYYGDIHVDADLPDHVCAENVNHEIGHATARQLCGVLDYTSEGCTNLVALILNQRDAYAPRLSAWLSEVRSLVTPARLQLRRSGCDPFPGDQDTSPAESEAS
jgi:hypothetical protein